ncbi:MAG: porin family protein [Acidobacteria bacterium]|nr:porin family protein [Acidobacteriota bacterium]MCI0628487.1 porin family protein [Acidobacteriota bacterium]MCI0719789.1 porin family protein [Acidobacteriota bacterium]
MKTRLFVLVLAGVFCFGVRLKAQRTPFAGGLVGISALSADGRSLTTGSEAAVSLYKPENGAALNFFGGVHLTDFLSLQGSYVWNRNRLTLTATRTSAAEGIYYEVSRNSTQHSVIGDLLLYFRDRRSWARPYLSVGSGLVRFTSKEQALLAVRGTPQLPPQEFKSNAGALRVAVGIDFNLNSNWSFRYSFSETIRRNPISEQLSPPGQRNLANFQNLFGFFIRL